MSKRISSDVSFCGSHNSVDSVDLQGFRSREGYIPRGFESREG